MNVSDLIRFFRENSVYWFTVFFYIFYWLLLVTARGDITATVGFGCYSPELCFSEQNKSIMPEDSLVYTSGGYDGQFYYYISAGWLYGVNVSLDSDAFRLSRIGYPLILAPAWFFGPEALVIWMSVSLLLGHLISVVTLRRFLDRSEARNKQVVLWLYSLNPFTLQSFLLNVSDGLALSAAVTVLSLYFTGQKSDVDSRNPVSGPGYFNNVCRFCNLSALWFLVSWMLLVKETFLAVPAAFTAACLIQILFSESRSRISLIRRAFWWMSTSFPLLIWWEYTGFSPFLAAERGGFPFSGFLKYLTEPDALFSGRGVLSVLLPFMGITFFFYLWKQIRKKHRPDWLLSNGLILILGADLLLVSAATEHEYWANYANAVRLFTPGILSLLLLPAAAGYGQWLLYITGSLFAVHNIWILKDLGI